MDRGAHLYAACGVAALAGALVGFAAVGLLTASPVPSLLHTAAAAPPGVVARPTMSLPLTPAPAAARSLRLSAASQEQPTALQGPPATGSRPFSLPLLAPLAAAVGLAAGWWWGRRAPPTLAAHASTGEVSRRAAIQSSLALAVGATVGAAPALAGIPDGFRLQKDPYDGYEFLYPFGWQELQVDGQDCLFKDVIEPLETIGVTITPTAKTSVTELGDVKPVCFTIADQFLTGPNQQVTLLDARAEDSNGVTYYTMEFLSVSPSYTRHALAALAVRNGKLYTCLTGSSQKRWPKIEARLRTAIESFTVFTVNKTI